MSEGQIFYVKRKIIKREKEVNAEIINIYVKGMVNIYIKNMILFSRLTQKLEEYKHYIKKEQIYNNVFVRYVCEKLAMIISEIPDNDVSKFLDEYNGSNIYHVKNNIKSKEIVEFIEYYLECIHHLKSFLKKNPPKYDKNNLPNIDQVLCKLLFGISESKFRFLEVLISIFFEKENWDLKYNPIQNIISEKFSFWKKHGSKSEITQKSMYGFVQKHGVLNESDIPKNYDVKVWNEFVLIQINYRRKLVKFLKIIIKNMSENKEDNIILVKLFLQEYKLPEYDIEHDSTINNIRFLSNYEENVKRFTEAKNYIFQENNTDRNSAHEKLQLIICDIYDEIIRNYNNMIYLHGSRAIKTLTKDGIYEKYTKDIKTFDIDVKTVNSKALLNFVKSFMVRYINIYNDNDKNQFVIENVTSRQKIHGMNTISITMAIKCDKKTIVVRESIMDIMEMEKSFSFDDVFVTKKNMYSKQLHFQSFLSYLCGIVDKLFGSFLNPRIHKDDRISSSESTIEKLKCLEGCNISVEDYQIIQIISNNREFVHLNDEIYGTQAKLFLFGFVEGFSLQSLINVYFNPFQKSLKLKNTN